MAFKSFQQIFMYSRTLFGDLLYLMTSLSDRYKITLLIFRYLGWEEKEALKEPLAIMKWECLQKKAQAICSTHKHQIQGNMSYLQENKIAILPPV